jgi:hypothetical protein
MSKNTQLATATVNGQANDMAARCNNGYVRIYDGAQPADADTAVSTQVLLAELRFGATAFGTAVGGVITANSITADSDANNTGTATWFRALASDGTTSVFDGSVGTTNANMVIATTSIAQHQTVSCSSLTHTVAKSTSGL